jgi:hypothetical protein
MIDLNKCANVEIAKQSLNEELAIRIRNRRNRLLGLWAATELGMTGGEADTYANALMALGIDHSSDETLVNRIVGDKLASGAKCQEQAVQAEMDRLSQIAALEYAANESYSRPKAA